MRRTTKEDRVLIKGALRRAFSRSALKAAALDAAQVEHFDPRRPKVKRWCLCNYCKRPEARSYVEVDHIEPWVPLDKSWDSWVQEVGMTVVVDGLWCPLTNLQVLCFRCHAKKTASEAAIRRVHRAKRR